MNAPNGPIRIRYERANGDKRTVVAPRDVAWEVARTLAKTHGEVTMVGHYGEATVLRDGSGAVLWLDTAEPDFAGKVTTFDAHTLVCL